MPRITFQKETVKELQRQLHEAYALGDVRLVRRIAVLLAIARGEGLSQVEEQWAILVPVRLRMLTSFQWTWTQ